MLRSLTATGLVLALSACQPDLPHTAPTPVATAVFDPTTGSIPLPNDLAFLNPPNSVCPAPANTMLQSPPLCAQAELLTALAGQFPSDQEVGITIDFVQTNFGADGKPVAAAPDLDLASFTSDRVFVVNVATGVPTPVAIEAPTADDYKKGTDRGTLTLHNKDHKPWEPGTYIAVVRGGANGVRTTDGIAIGPSQVFYLIAQGLDMTDPKNIGLLKAQTGSTAAALEQGRSLNILIALYKSSVFAVADTKFPHQELAAATTFKIGPKVTNVTIDAARGEVPLPIDLLRDATTGKLSARAACSLAGSALDKEGKCPSAAAGGFAALDGFSTTGAILGPTSFPVLANTVTSASLLLYELKPTGPELVPASELIFEPCEFTNDTTATCNAANPAAQVIAIQPAGGTRKNPASLVQTRPLKDNTNYAVVMTTDIKDVLGKSIGPGTVAKVLRFTNPITVGGKSGLSGIDDATAASLEKMRLQLQPVFAKLAAEGKDASKIAMAYTFKTQTILSQAVQLAALPYTKDAGSAAPGVVTGDRASVLAKYNAAALPSDQIQDLMETDITTFNALDPATGAFLADPTQATSETIHVLIATPLAANVPNLCEGSNNVKCAPMMVFRHGFGRGRLDMLAIANSYAAAGMVTVAIDAAKHGDRTFCTPGSTEDCVGGAACTTALPAGAQGDVHPPGTCGAAGFVSKAFGPNGIPLVSGNFLVSANFFRTRDTMRQDLIDESQLIRALAFNPAGGGSNTVFTRMAATGVVINPALIYYSGQSLGAIQGTMNVATNPRISKAALNVGGGTIVDVFTNSSEFASVVGPLLLSLGIDKVADPAGYLKFLTVAKTVLDPADPINYAGHLTDHTLPNLLPPLGGNPDGMTPQLPKKILTQIAYCDEVVPNAFSLIHSANIGVGPLPPAALVPGTVGTFQLFTKAGFDANNFGKQCPQAGAVGHGFLLDLTNPALALKAQADIATWITSTTNFLPPSVEQ